MRLQPNSIALLIPILIALTDIRSAPSLAAQAQRCDALIDYFKRESIWWKLDAYYEVARQQLEKKESNTRPPSPYGHSTSATGGSGLQQTSWWLPHWHVEKFVRDYRRIGCVYEESGCAQDGEAVALMENFVLYYMALHSANPLPSQPRAAPKWDTLGHSLFTETQTDMLYELKHGPFAPKNTQYGAVMALLREIILEQGKQRAECAHLQLQSSDASLDLHCPQAYLLNEPGNRSEALEDMVSLAKNVVRFNIDQPDQRFAIFPALRIPRSKESAFWLAASSAALTVAVSKACLAQGILCNGTEDEPQEFKDVLERGWSPERPSTLRSDSLGDEYDGDSEEYAFGGADTNAIDEETPLSLTERLLFKIQLPETDSEPEPIQIPSQQSARGKVRLEFRDTTVYQWDSGCWHSPNTGFAAEWVADFMEPEPEFQTWSPIELRQLAFIRHNIQVGIQTVLKKRHFKCACQVFYSDDCKQAVCFWELPSTSEIMIQLSEALKDAMPLSTFSRRRQNMSTASTLSSNSTSSRPALIPTSAPTPSSAPPRAATASSLRGQHLLRSDGEPAPLTSSNAMAPQNVEPQREQDTSSAAAAELEDRLVYLPLACSSPRTPRRRRFNSK